MIKIVTVINNRRTLMLGLSRENTTRLHDDKPIAVDVQALLAQITDVDDVQDVVIFAGETEDAMFAELRKHGVVVSPPDRGTTVERRWVRSPPPDM